MESARRLDAWVHMALCQSRSTQADEKAAARVLLVLASKRDDFFGEGLSAGDLSSYFDTEYLSVDGDHLGAMAACVSGQVRHFNTALSDALQE